MSSIEIVRLKQEHLNRLVPFFDEISTPDYMRDFSPHPFDEEHARSVCNYQGLDRYYAVLLDGEKIIAYCMLRGWDEGYEIPSLGLCVLKPYQGYGIGRIILNFLETTSSLNGCSKVMLKIKKDNALASNLYVTQGYVFREHSDDFLIGFKNISKGANT
jgi:ribosomal protein S18 acetylase RimI-like enzyme